MIKVYFQPKFWERYGARKFRKSVREMVIKAYVDCRSGDLMRFRFNGGFVIPMRFNGEGVILLFDSQRNMAIGFDWEIASKLKALNAMLDEKEKTNAMLEETKT